MKKVTLKNGKKLSIRPVEAMDQSSLLALFKTVIPKTFEAEGVGHLLDDINDEIQHKRDFLHQALREDDFTFLLVAYIENKLVGCVSVTKANTMIIDNIPSSKDSFEIGSLFVDYAYHDLGIGQNLLAEAEDLVRRQGKEYYYLDSGYGRAQKVWQHLLGKPSLILPDYWAEGVDHMIWEIKIQPA